MFVPCLISIISATEEQETPFQLEGKGEFSCLKTVLVYNDGGADVRIEARNDGVTIERQGDYSMQILLREKQTTKGNLGIMGQRGDLDVYTEKLGFSSTER
ncbi:MAG: DUF1934 family protein, partial [Clostridia bacterium]|nr:DUF1934 family protein [Clostridia bacterium]